MKKKQKRVVKKNKRKNFFKKIKGNKILIKITFIFLWILFFLFAGIILFQSFKEGRTVLVELINREKQEHLAETCSEIKEAEKIVKEFEDKIQNLKVGKNELSQEDKNEIFLNLIELEKRATSLQANFFDYKNDSSLMIFDFGDKTMTDLIHDEIKNLKVYIDSLERSVENISTEYYLTEDDFYFFEFNLNEFGEKLKSIRKNSGACY